jgi:hypothetical protein
MTLFCITSKRKTPHISTGCKLFVIYEMDASALISRNLGWSAALWGTLIAAYLKLYAHEAPTTLAGSATLGSQFLTMS